MKKQQLGIVRKGENEVFPKPISIVTKLAINSNCLLNVLINENHALALLLKSSKITNILK